MSLPQIHIDLIHKRLSGELTQEEQLLFDQLLKENQAFSDRLLFESSLLAYLEAEQKSKLKQELRGYFDMPVAVRKGANWSRFKWAYAAAVLILGISALMFFLTDQNQHDAIFDDFYAPYPTQGLVRSDLEESNTERIIRRYDTGAYDQFIAGAEMLNDDVTKAKPIYLAIAYLETDQAQKALEVLSALNDGHPYYVESLWYGALIHLKLKNESMALKQLRLLSEIPSIYQGDAMKLMEIIE